MPQFSDLDAKKFTTNFFNEIDKILEKKGGKRKYKNISNKRRKKQKGGVKDGELILPVPLDTQNIQLVNELKEKVGKRQSLNLVQSASSEEISQPITADYDRQVNTKFAEHIKSLIETIGSKTALEMTPEELQIMSLYINYKSLNPEISIASNIVNKEANNLLKMNTTTMVEVKKQVQVIKDVTDNTIKEIEHLSTLYENKTSSLQISSQSTSCFVNLMGRLTVLLSTLSNYKNKIKTFNNKLKNDNPAIFYVIKALYSSISFILFALFKIFTFLLNSWYGKVFLMYCFIVLYKNNNFIAVFLANMFMKLLTIADEFIGASEYVNSCITSIQQYVVDSIPTLLSNAVISGLLKSTLIEALSDSTVLARFANHIAPKISEQILERALPTITDAVLQSAPELAQQITPMVLEGAKQGAIEASSIIAEQVAPLLIEGITHTVETTAIPLLENAVTTTVTTAVTTTMTEIAKDTATAAATDAMYKSVTNVAFKYGVTAIADYFGIGEPVRAITNSVPSITNYGGKKTKKRIKFNKSKTYRKK